jgi:hypothetical protein
VLVSERLAVQGEKLDREAELSAAEQELIDLTAIEAQVLPKERQQWLEEEAEH